MMRRRVLMQFGAASTERIFSAIVQGISLLLIARAVTPGQFGLLSAILGAAWVAQTLFDLGLTTFVVRERANDRTSGVVTAALNLYNRLSIALCLSAFGVLLLGGLQGHADMLKLLPISVWMAVDRNADAWMSVIFADGDWRRNLANVIFRRVASLVSFVILDLMGVDPLLAFSLAWAIASTVAAVVARSFVRPLLPEAESVDIRNLVRETWPYWLHSLATQVKNLDVALTGVLSGPHQAGIFAAAARLTSPLRILPTSLARAILPAASRGGKKALQGELVIICIAMLAGITAFYLALFWIAPYALPKVVGEPYRPAVTPLRIVLLGLPFAAGSSLLGSLLQGADQKHFVANVSLATTILYFMALSVGILVNGAIGAVVALVFSYVVQFTLYLAAVILLVREHRSEGEENHSTPASIAKTRLDRSREGVR